MVAACKAPKAIIEGINKGAAIPACAVTLETAIAVLIATSANPATLFKIAAFLCSSRFFFSSIRFFLSLSASNALRCSSLSFSLSNKAA